MTFPNLPPLPTDIIPDQSTIESTIMAMADSRGALPQVLVLKQVHLIDRYTPQISQKFDILKAYESQLPTNLYLSEYASSVRALLCSAQTPITNDVLQQLPSLQVVVTNSAGINHIDLPECRRRGISIASAGNVFSEDCADMAVGLLIDVLRKISAGDTYVRNRLWPIKGDFPLGFRLGGKRVGIVGLGSIGSEVAKRLEAFGCIISYNSRSKKASFPYPYFETVHELAANSDALIVCCSLTDQTWHMINREILLALGKDGVIVNVARGSIIDEQEMVKCLVQGELGGAGLDVFEHEPIVPQELFALDNVVLTPHRAVFTPESFETNYEQIMANLEAFFSGNPLISPVLDE